MQLGEYRQLVEYMQLVDTGRVVTVPGRYFLSKIAKFLTNYQSVWYTTMQRKQCGVSQPAQYQPPHGNMYGVSQSVAKQPRLKPVQRQSNGGNATAAKTQSQRAQAKQPRLKPSFGPLKL